MKKLIAIIVFSLCGVSMVSAQYASREQYRKDQYAHTRGNYDRNSRTNGVAMINVMQKQSREKIARGIVNGTINAGEAKKLLSFAEKIERKEDHYLRNGRLTNSEVRELESDLNQLNRMITKDKRDGQKAPVDYRHKSGQRRF